ncbi:hypothetical protein F5Y18DRAFT_424888 [Xylariaceae sp. FL1019]|nr:hypothetical protein F5Y18DRAFT_424888 [Xylariaceae sp. FL1019]
MANLSYELIAASTPFTILVGPERKKFNIHRELLASMSKKLDTLVNGKMIEARDGLVDWGDLDEQTFLCFFEYAYTGDYNIPQLRGNGRAHNDISRSQNDDQSQVHNISAGFSGCSSVLSDNKLRMRCPQCSRNVVVPVPAPPPKAKDLLWLKFISLEYPGPLPKANTTPPNGSVSLELSRMILSHARVYVLADYQLINNLKLLSLKKLHQCLKGSELTSEGAETIASLAAYCYDNTADSDPKDQLRELLCLYLACKVEQMWENASFRKALEASRDLARDVIEQMLNRLD